MTVVDLVRHQLSLVVRYEDHFLGHPVPDELPVRVAVGGPENPRIQPVRTSSGISARHSDGTYRFIDLPDGVHRVLWTPPLGTPADRTTRWVSWEVPLDVAVPRPDPTAVVVQPLWPSARAVTPKGMSAVRGKLRGPGATDRRVEIHPPSESPVHFTRTDSGGEFLFLLPFIPTLDANGRISLVIAISGGSVTGGELLSDAGSGATFVGAAFTIPPGRESRVVFDII